jgi:hypothetical protein
LKFNEISIIFHLTFITRAPRTGTTGHRFTEEAMAKHVVFWTLLATFAAMGTSNAQAPRAPTDVTMQQVVEEPRVKSRNPTDSFLFEIVRWLSANFDLPVVHELPRVEFAPPMRLAGMRYKGVLSDRWREDSIPDPAVPAAHQREVIAIYNDTTKTIFLSNTWTGATAAELSVLVHEMVHHVQNLAGLKYECSAAREKLGYQAQNRWLKLSGTDLESEFDIDMMTLLVTSSCMH